MLRPNVSALVFLLAGTVLLAGDAPAGQPPAEDPRWEVLPDGQQPEAQPVATRDESSPDASHLIRWTDRRGVPHLTNEPPVEYEVSHDEWLRLKAEYPGQIKDEAPVEQAPSVPEADLPPGTRAEQALQDWWNIAGPKGGFRGHAVVTPDELTELTRLVDVAKAALKEARGNDFSPSTGRAAIELRRVLKVDVSVRDPIETSGIPIGDLYPVSVAGKLVRGMAIAQYEVAGRISNRSLKDAPGLSIALDLRVDGKVVATRDVTIPRIMARGEAPIRTIFDLPRAFLRVDDSRLSVSTRVVPIPALPAVGG
ncbi:MAG: hypothetical protein U0166_25420 [Acidobacteriota bacterium]